MNVTTRQQREAIYVLFRRIYDISYESPAQLWRRYRAFRRGFTWGFGGEYIGGQWCGMYVGIELDGHTHS
jgi:hypothetical protein